MKFLMILIFFTGCSNLKIVKDCKIVEDSNLQVCKTLKFWE